MASAGAHCERAIGPPLFVKYFASAHDEFLRVYQVGITDVSKAGGTPETPHTRTHASYALDCGHSVKARKINPTTEDPRTNQLVGGSISFRYYYCPNSAGVKKLGVQWHEDLYSPELTPVI